MKKLTIAQKRTALAAYFADNLNVWIELDDTPAYRFGIKSAVHKTPSGVDLCATHLTANGFLADEIDPYGDRLEEVFVPYGDANPAAIRKAYDALDFALNVSPKNCPDNPIIYN